MRSVGKRMARGLCQKALLRSRVSFLLAHEVVGDPAAARTAWVLHGIFGSRRNWRSFAQAFTAAAPDWRFVLVDLRHHGASRGAPPPDSLEACATDLETLAHHLAAAPAALIGHSFGGKVALAAVAAFVPHLRQVWLMDSAPGLGPPRGAAREGAGAGRVLAALRQMPHSSPSRGVAGEQLETAGVPRQVARWLVTSMVREGAGFVWPFPLAALQDLLDSYWDFDGWATLEGLGATAPKIHLVMGAKSEHFSPSAKQQARASEERKLLRCYELADAGHWVQVDAPAGLMQLMHPHFVAPRA